VAKNAQEVSKSHDKARAEKRSKSDIGLGFWIFGFDFVNYSRRLWNGGTVKSAGNGNNGPTREFAPECDVSTCARLRYTIRKLRIDLEEHCLMLGHLAIFSADDIGSDELWQTVASVRLVSEKRRHPLIRTFRLFSASFLGISSSPGQLLVEAVARRQHPSC
jgi:hypothetical protein